VSRVLEIAASTRVLRERRLRALEESPAGAVLGRDFVTFRGFAERCAAETGVAVRGLLDGAALTELVSLSARGNGALGERLAERPGLAPALASTLLDLRDAGVSPSDLPRPLADLAATGSAFERALARLERDGIFDRIGLFRLARLGARPHLVRRRFERIEVHGATELVGSVGDLLDESAQSLPLAFFQPDFASTYVQRLDEEWPWSFRPQPTEMVASPALDPDGAIPDGALLVRRARSPRAELDGVAREVLSLIERGVAPNEIQVVARMLEPYAPWLESIFRGYGIPFTSSLRVPAIASPARRAWLDLVHAVTRNLERAPVVRLLESAALRLDPAIAALGEKVSRKSGVVRGESDWETALEDESSHSRPPLVHQLARLRACGSALEDCADFAAAARCVGAFGEELFGAASSEQIVDSLDAVARLDAVRAAAGASEPPRLPDFRRAFEAALADAKATPFGDDGGGVRVLDAIQARAVPCRHLFLIGMVHGAWPRSLPDDPFLPESVRADLRTRIRRPVPLRRAVAAEDRFLLGLLLSQTTDRVVLSFPDCDSLGRIQNPSALLRSLPFAAPGTDVLANGVETWESLESRYLRPAQALQRSVRSPEAAAIGIRLSPDTAETVRRGLTLLDATEALVAESLPYDGVVGDSLKAPASLSPSQLEELGQCPLRAFFNRFLRAEPLDPRSADELEANESGNFVHDALERIYSQLFDEGLLARGGSLAAAFARARALVPTALDQSEVTQRALVRWRRPTAWAAFRGTIQRALEDFLERDLARLLPGGVDELETERVLSLDLRLGNDSLRVTGKIDRIAWLADGDVRVGDYKTTQSTYRFDYPVQSRRVHRGLSLQVPLYTRMVTARDGASESLYGEALTVPLRPERDLDRERDEERKARAADLASQSEKPLAELASLVRRGVFPLANDPKEACRYCEYKVACRIHHPPSVGRVEQSDSMRGYLALADEGKRK
jgi:RecB family exonuclease